MMRLFSIGVVFAASMALMSCSGADNQSGTAIAQTDSGSSLVGAAALSQGASTIAYYVDGQGQVIVCRSNTADTSCAPAEVQAPGGQGNYRGLGAAVLRADEQVLAYYLDNTGRAIVCRSNAANTSCGAAERQAGDAP